MGKAQPVVVGVDVGGTKVLVGCVGVDGTVHLSQRYPMDRTSQASTLASIQSAVDDLCGLPGLGRRPFQWASAWLGTPTRRVARGCTP